MPRGPAGHDAEVAAGGNRCSHPAPLRKALSVLTAPSASPRCAGRPQRRRGRRRARGAAPRRWRVRRRCRDGCASTSLCGATFPSSSAIAGNSSSARLATLGRKSAGQSYARNPAQSTYPTKSNTRSSSRKRPLTTCTTALESHRPSYDRHSRNEFACPSLILSELNFG